MTERAQALGQQGAGGDGDDGLQVVDLVVGYGRRAVLQPISETARAGQVTVVLGRNGSGKSTLLRTIAGLQPALAGTVLLDGQELMALDPRARARRVAVVLTDRFEPGLLRGIDVVRMGRHPYRGGLSEAAGRDEAAVHEALEAVHAAGWVSRRIAELSDGERQRILIARALAQEPELLVLDEPSAFLDAPGRLELLAVLATVARERGIPVVVSTHDVEAALRVGEYGWVVDGGRLQSGPVDGLVRSVIGPVFDSDRVVFDPEAVQFRLRPGR